MLPSPSDKNDDVVPPLAMRATARDVVIAEEWGIPNLTASEEVLLGCRIVMTLMLSSSSRLFDRLLDVDTVGAKPVNGRPPPPTDGSRAADDDEEDGNDDRNEVLNMRKII